MKHDRPDIVLSINTECPYKTRKSLWSCCLTLVVSRKEQIVRPRTAAEVGGCARRTHRLWLRRKTARDAQLGECYTRGARCNLQLVRFWAPKDLIGTSSNKKIQQGGRTRYFARIQAFGWTVAGF